MGKLLLIALVLIGVWFFFFAETASNQEAADPPAASYVSGGVQSIANAEDRILDLAQRERLNVRFGDGNDLHIQLEWGGNQATRGGEFLLVLLHEGVISDFDPEGKGQRRNDNQGGWIWSQSFVLKLKSVLSKAQ